MRGIDAVETRFGNCSLCACPRCVASMPLLREGTDALAVSLRPCLSIGGHGHDFVARFLPPVCSLFCVLASLIGGHGRVRTFFATEILAIPINHTDLNLQ